jgi:hypothetical protein
MVDAMAYDYDAAFIQACEVVSAAGYASNFILRDRLGISYVKAVVLMKMLQAAGSVGQDIDDAACFALIEPRGFY